MTNEEAKFLLQGYRPNGQDAENAAMAEALAQAERDPSLRAWFEREREFDALIAGKLRDVAPPPGLRESILAGTKLSTREAQPDRANPAWWRGFWGVSLAAAAAVLVATMWWFNPARGPTVVTLPSADLLLKTALADYRGAHEEGLHADSLGPFGDWLETATTKLSAQPMPASLQDLAERGCRSVEVGGHRLFEICFLREGEWYHVYLAPRDDFDPASMHDEPMFHEQGRFVAATWADQKFVYLVSSTSGIDSLRRLL